MTDGTPRKKERPVFGTRDERAWIPLPEWAFTGCGWILLLAVLAVVVISVGGSMLASCSEWWKDNTPAEVCGYDDTGEWRCVIP